MPAAQPNQATVARTQKYVEKYFGFAAECRRSRTAPSGIAAEDIDTIFA